MNLFLVMSSPAFQKAALEMAKHWPLSYHIGCLPTRLAARLMFGDDDEEHQKQAAKAIDQKEVMAGLLYDHNLHELIPELVDLAEVYDVPLADVAQVLLVMSRTLWQPDVPLLNRSKVMEKLGFKDASMRRLEMQGRVPPTMRVSDGKPVWTEPAIEGWVEIVEARRKLPYQRGYLVYPPYDGKKLSEYTNSQPMKRRKTPNR